MRRQNESKVVQEMIEAMAANYGRALRIWIMNRSTVSEANLEFLRG